ncbi:MAG: hypothetical protein ACI9Y7_000005 [Dokdonia sp.]|jgi:hypothetical protein
MKKIINILFVFFSCALCFSQATIDLKTIPFEIKDQNFYIEKVFNDEQDAHLGVIEDHSGNKVTLRLQNGTARTIKEFMDTTLPKTSGKTPIHIRINNLKIEQAQTSIDTRTARVYIALNFYAESGEELYKVEHYEDQVFPESDVTKIHETHEQRIRAALEYCLWSFINRPKPDLTNNTLKNGNRSKTSFASEKSDFESYVPLGKWFDILTFKRVIDTYNEGWEIAYTGFSDSEKDLIIPFEIAYGQSRATSDVVKKRGYRSVNSYALGFGLSGYIKITPGFYVDLGLNVPIGIEVLSDLEDKKSTNFLIGISSHQGVKIIPWKDYGIVIGAGLFQRFQTSKVINRNFGFELELGINF